MAFYQDREIKVLSESTALVQIEDGNQTYWVKKEQIFDHPVRVKKRVGGKKMWENVEKRQAVLRRLLNNPSAYMVAAWLLKNNAHVHLSLSPTESEDGRLLELVHSQIADVQDSDVSTASEATQGSTFTITIGGFRPSEEVLAAFKNIDVAPTVYYDRGTSVQKWGFVFDFFMVELGIGFNHNIDIQSVVNRIPNNKYRELFVNEMNGNY